MVALQSCSKQIQMNIHNQMYANLLTRNAGSTQVALALVCKHFWCVDVAARIVCLLPWFMNKKKHLFSIWCGALAYECTIQRSFKALQNNFLRDTGVLVFMLMGVRLPNIHVSHVWHFCSAISVCRPIKCRKVLSAKLQEMATSRQVCLLYVQLGNCKQYIARPPAYRHHHHDHINIFIHTQWHAHTPLMHTHHYQYTHMYTRTHSLSDTHAHTSLHSCTNTPLMHARTHTSAPPIHSLSHPHIHSLTRIHRYHHQYTRTRTHSHNSASAKLAGLRHQTRCQKRWGQCVLVAVRLVLAHRRYWRVAQ